jgi:hypothetical protein
MAYGYTSPVASEKPTEKPTPIRQGSLNFGASSRANVGAPPTSSMFSGTEVAAKDENRSPQRPDTIVAASSSHIDGDEFANDQFDRWITVFGFPSSYSSTILTYFHNFGQILRVKHSENGGNWIHLLYMTKLQAEKALGKNGKILDPGNIMIGVVKCTDQSVLSDRVPAPTPSKRLRTDSFNPSLSDYAVAAPEPQPAPSTSAWSRFLENVIGY